MGEARSLEGCSILVAEDEFFQADELAAAFGSAGARLVGPFATVDATLAAVEAQRVDAAILDINLRGQSVAPVADLLAARGVPFLFTTGYDRDMLPPSFREAEIWQKPFDLAQLVAAVARLCGPHLSSPDEPPRV